MSYVTNSRVFHVRIRFDIGGFYLEGASQGGRVTTVEEVLNMMCAQAHPLQNGLVRFFFSF